MKDKLILKIYINGLTSVAKRAISNLEDVCAEYKTDGNYTIEVIDIKKRPQLAEDEKIVATPTVIKLLPEPISRIIGDLSQKEQLLMGLDLVEK